MGGLAGAYFLLKHKRPQKTKQYAEPFSRMIDRLLEVGRNSDGVTVERDRLYKVQMSGWPPRTRLGAELIRGVPLSVDAGDELIVEVAEAGARDGSRTADR